jgi:hypothetical protein
MKKSMFLAAAGVLGIGIGTAYAGDGDGPLANTYFAELPGIVTQPLAPKVQRWVGIGTAGDGTGSYVTRSLPNPTGQTSYGPHGEISLWEPNPNA